MRPIKALIPNLISSIRLLLIYPLILSLKYDNLLVLIITSVIIVFSDYFDGFLARRWQLISESGKVLDPLSDKICTAAGAFAMVFYRGFPLWLLISLIVRDFIILAGGLHLYRSRKYIPVSDITGRITMGMIAACLLIYLFRIEQLKIPVTVMTLAIMIASIVSYARRFFAVLKSGPA
jgi:CDP-diacylglycerol--glycerol-3-phosphate 3-phosphatidyltransferase